MRTRAPPSRFPSHALPTRPHRNSGIGHAPAAAFRADHHLPFPSPAPFGSCVSPREFVDAVTGDLLVSGKRVFVFTPKGEVMNLARGATVVDYAYHIHTELGNNMVAAKVNGVVVPPSHSLRNAEVVEIITYKGKPTAKTLRMHAQWGAFCTTKSARHKILKFLRDHSFSALPPEAGAEGVESMADPELRMDWAVADDDDDESSDDDDERGPQRGACVGCSFFSSIPLLGRVDDALAMVRSFSGEEADPFCHPDALSSLPAALTDERKRAAVMAEVAATAAAAQAAAPPDDMDEGGPLGGPDDAEVALYSRVSASQLILRIECGDRTGLLADVSSLIARHGMAIRTYSGKPLDEGRGTCSMGFELGGDQRNVNGLCRELSMVPNVIRWRIYCTWSPPVGQKGKGVAGAGRAAGATEGGTGANGSSNGVYNSSNRSGNGIGSIADGAAGGSGHGAGRLSSPSPPPAAETGSPRGTGDTSAP